MNLPEIEMIGLQAAQRFLQHPHREVLVAAMRADLGHQETWSRRAFQAFAHPVFGFAAMIFPAVVEEGDAAVDGFVHQADSGLLVFGVAEMVAAESERGNLVAVPSEGTERDTCRLGHIGANAPGARPPPMNEMDHFALAASGLHREYRISMPYHFKRRESLPDGVRRVVTEELSEAMTHLSGKSKAKLEVATHEARKSIKKVRAALRLVRPELGKSVAKENLRLRHVGRKLSEIRDASALIGALEHLDKGSVADAVRRALVARKARIEEEKNVAELFPQLAKTLGKIRREIKSWKLRNHGFDAIESGIEETYRSGQKALKTAETKSRSD